MEAQLKTYLYTFIMDYLEGCFISQVNSEDEISAMKIWLQQLDVSVISKEEKDKLIEQNFIDEDPVLIKGCKNVWCFTLKINENARIALINVVKTFG